MQHISEKLTFTIEGRKIAARLDKPKDQTPIAYAIYAHCFTCSKDFPTSSRVSRALAQRGIATLRFDFSGLGESEGAFCDTNFNTNIAEVLAAYAFLEEFYEAPLLAVGHSLGGTAILKAGQAMPNIKIISTLNSPYEPAHLFHHFGDQIDTIRLQGEAEVDINGIKHTIKKHFLEVAEQTDMAKTLANLNKQLIIFHAPEDSTAPLINAQKIYQAANQPKSFISLEGADHFLTQHEDSSFVADILTSWVKKEQS